MSSIQFLRRKDIDEKKWNACIASSKVCLPYAYSWYLDAVADHWDALVSGDYEVVFPLVWLKKFGIKCLYQPYYCQQLGAFGESPEEDTQRKFLEHITAKFKYINININASAAGLAGQYKFTARKNLLLKLDSDYKSLNKKFAENHIRNINKALKAGVTLQEGTGLTPFQKFYLGNINPERENFKPRHIKIFRELSGMLVQGGTGRIYSAINKEGELLAAVLMIEDAMRMINIINTSSQQGKRTGASHFLFDQIIQKFAGTGAYIDFEGSSIPGIARFYSGFGAQEEIFYHYRLTIIGKLSQLFV